MNKIGYRTEEMYGERYRKAAEVMSYEVFSLSNTDILDTLSETILKNTQYEEKLKQLSDVIVGNINDKDLDDFCDKAFEDEDIGIHYFEEIINEINIVTGKNINYVLWLCDSIEDIKNEYEITENEPFTSFDVYEKSNIVLSDLGRGGKLYGYENNPTPCSHKEINK